VEARTLVPGHPAVLARLEGVREVHAWAALLGAPARLLAGRAAGLDLLVLDAPEFFDAPAALSRRGRQGPRRQLAALRGLSLAGAQVAGGLLPGYAPDLLHAHDWQAGLAPAYMRYARTPAPR
jgi:starch synthase